MIFNLNATLSMIGLVASAAGADATTIPVLVAGEMHLEAVPLESATELVGRTDADPGSPVRIVALELDASVVGPGDARMHGARPIGWASIGPGGVFRFAVPTNAYGRTPVLAAAWTGPGGAVRVATTRLPRVDPATPIRTPPAPGTLIVTEFMKDPAAVPDTRGEWIEVHNLSGTPIDLEGWTLRDLGSNRTVLAGPNGAIPVPPGAFVVIGRNADPALNGGVAIAAAYSGFTLANGADQIVLEAPGAFEVERVEYGDGPTWPDDSGRSVSLSERAWGTPLASAPGAWCSGESLMPGGDLGTPGAPNDVCGD